MAQRRPFDRHKSGGPRRGPPPVAAPKPVYQKPAPKQYGAPFVLLEDEAKQTFEFVGGAWTPYALSIAECRTAGEVTQLAQKVNRMTRYQVRLETNR